MKKIFNSKLFWAIIAVIMSFSAWLYLESSMSEDMITRTIRGVRVEFIGENSLKNTRNMVITDVDTNTVVIEVTGPGRSVNSLNADDIVAQIDVSKLSRAAYTSQTYHISFPDGTDKSVEVTKKTPETVSFMVSELTTKPVQVRGSFNGDIGEGHTAEAPVFEPATVTVTGPEAYLRDIEYAWVSFGGGVTADATYKTETGFVLMDKSGNECSTTGLTFSDDVILASLPVLDVRDVMLDVNVIDGAGAVRDVNCVITVEPAFITLAGDSALLSGYNKIILKTIDLTDFTTTFTDTYPIVLNNDLKNLTGITEATVKIEIVGLSTRTFKVTNLTCIGVTDGYKPTIMSKSVDITLRGPAEVLERITADNIRAVADLTDYDQSTGTYMAEAKVYIDGHNDVGALGDNKILIELVKEQ